MTYNPEEEIVVSVEAVEPEPLMTERHPAGVWIRNAGKGFMVDVEVRGPRSAVYDYVVARWGDIDLEQHIVARPTRDQAVMPGTGYISLETAQGSVRTSLSRALAESLTLGIDACQAEGCELSENQKVLLATMAIMSYDEAISEGERLEAWTGIERGRAA